ncbi:MAG: hypothetical protein IH851_01865 [Armatimonadetes bacterium]|nr:hypothetical protein [Armatimonadota bacterium]
MWFALAAFALAMLSVGWVRGFGYVSFFGDAAFGAYALGVVAALMAGGSLGFRAARPTIGEKGPVLRGAVSGALAVAIGLVFVFTAALVLPSWIGQIGAYAIPRLPDWLAALIAVTAVTFAVLSVTRRERAIGLAALSALLGGYTLVTALVWDRLVDSPHALVRRFAAAAYRKDMEQMLALASKSSHAWMNDPSITQYLDGPEAVSSLVVIGPFHPGAVRNALIDRIEIDGDRAVVECPVPRGSGNWTMYFLKSHGHTIYLVKDEGQWRVDVQRYYEERYPFWEIIEDMQQKESDEEPAQ